MKPILFHIPFTDIPIYSYGLMMVIGFLLGIQITKYLARRVGIDPEIFVNVGLIALVTGVLGARLSHVLENWHEFSRTSEAVMSDAEAGVVRASDATYVLTGEGGRVLATAQLKEKESLGFEHTPNGLVAVAGSQRTAVNEPAIWKRKISAWENIKNAINIRSGGLTYYGGFLLAFPSLVLYAIKKKVPIRLGMDIVAPALMVGLGIGRIGCFMNGCCYGAVCEVPWAITYPYDSIPYVEQVGHRQLAPPPELVNENGRLVKSSELHARPALAQIARHERSLPVHPAQLYSALTAALIFALLMAYWTMPHATGRVFALMLMIEGITRFLLELLRVEPARTQLAGYGLSLSMMLGIGFVVLGALMWMYFGVTRDRVPQLAPAPAPAT